MVNKGDVLSAGAGTGDTLDINDTDILGGIPVDLVLLADRLLQRSLRSCSVWFQVSTWLVIPVPGSEVIGSTGANTIVGTAKADEISSGLGATL